MPAPRCPDNEFIETWLKLNGNGAKIAKALGVTERNVYQRRVSIEGRLGVALTSSPNSVTNRPKEYVNKIGFRINVDIKDGVLIAFGDEHIWPGDYSLARQALVWAIKELSPKIIVCDGDAFDGASISRHPPANWERTPDLADELDRCKELMGEIEGLAPEKCKLIWTCGNHDSRFSARLAQVAPEYVRVVGTDITDHFPSWNFSWSCWVNDSHESLAAKLIIQHNWKGGVHSGHGNVVAAGRSYATGHDHMLKVTPYIDANGIRYGVNLGSLSDFGPDQFKFSYAQDRPANHCAGFGIFTFDKEGIMLPPELVTVIGDKAYFRGKIVAVRAKKRK